MQKCCMDKLSFHYHIFINELRHWGFNEKGILLKYYNIVPVAKQLCSAKQVFNESLDFSTIKTSWTTEI